MPNPSPILFGTLVGSNGSVGSCVIYNGTNWVLYTPANVGSLTGCQIGVLLATVMQGGSAPIQIDGFIDPGLFNLGPGIASNLLAGAVPSRGNGGTVIGTCDANGLICLVASYVGTALGGGGGSQHAWLYDSAIPGTATTPSFSQAKSVAGAGQQMVMRTQAAATGSSALGGHTAFIAGLQDGAAAGGNLWRWGRETAPGGLPGGSFVTDMILLETTANTVTLSFGESGGPLVGAEIAAGCELSLATENNSPINLSPSNGAGHGQASFNFIQTADNQGQLGIADNNGVNFAAVSGYIGLPWGNSSSSQVLVAQRNSGNSGDLLVLSRQSGVLTHGSLSESQNFYGQNAIMYQIGGSGAGHSFVTPSGNVASLGLDTNFTWAQGDAAAVQFDSWSALLFHADTTSTSANQTIATIPIPAGTLTYSLAHLKLTIEGLNESTGDFATFSHKWSYTRSGGVLAAPTGSQPAATDDGHSSGAGTAILPQLAISGNTVLVQVTPWASSGIHWTTRVERNVNAGQKPNPTSPPGSPTFWWRADLQGLGTATTLSDQSGNGHNLSVFNGSASSVTSNSGPGGTLPSLVFSATSAYSIANALGVGTKNWTIAIVCKVTSTAASQRFCCVGAEGAGNGVSVGVDENAGNARDFNLNGVTAVSDGAATTSWEAWVFSSDASGNLTLLVNGASQSLSPSSGTAVSPSALFTVGANSSGTAQLVGNIFEVIVYSSIQTGSAIYAYQHAITGL